MDNKLVTAFKRSIKKISYNKNRKKKKCIL